MLRATLFVIGAVNAIQAPTNIHDQIQGVIHAQTEATGSPLNNNEGTTVSVVEQANNTEAVNTLAARIKASLGPGIKNLIN